MSYTEPTRWSSPPGLWIAFWIFFPLAVSLGMSYFILHLLISTDPSMKFLNYIKDAANSENVNAVGSTFLTFNLAMIALLASIYLTPALRESRKTILNSSNSNGPFDFRDESILAAASWEKTFKTTVAIVICTLQYVTLILFLSPFFLRCQGSQISASIYLSIECWDYGTLLTIIMYASFFSILNTFVILVTILRYAGKGSVDIFIDHWKAEKKRNTLFNELQSFRNSGNRCKLMVEAVGSNSKLLTFARKHIIPFALSGFWLIMSGGFPLLIFIYSDSQLEASLVVVIFVIEVVLSIFLQGVFSARLKLIDDSLSLYIISFVLRFFLAALLIVFFIGVFNASKSWSPEDYLVYNAALLIFSRYALLVISYILIKINKPSKGKCYKVVAVFQDFQCIILALSTFCMLRAIKWRIDYLDEYIKKTRHLL